MHFVLLYDFSADFKDRIGSFRKEHLSLAWAAHERGEVILGGALGEPVDTGMMLFQSESPDVAERFAKADPYVKNGIVTQWRVRKWTTVVGQDASSPIRPG